MTISVPLQGLMLTSVFVDYYTLPFHDQSLPIDHVVIVLVIEHPYIHIGDERWFLMQHTIQVYRLL